MKLGVIIPQEIINIIHTLQEHLLEVLEQDNKCEVAEEITENLFILMNIFCRGQLLCMISSRLPSSRWICEHDIGQARIWGKQ